MGTSPVFFVITGKEKCISGCINLLALIHAGHTPQESCPLPASPFGRGERTTSKRAGPGSLTDFDETQTMYCAKARAKGNAPLPSLPKNNKA